MYSINWTEVEGSSNITGIAYVANDPNADEGVLSVRFSSGSEYNYAGVPADLAVDFFNAASKGKFFHQNIRADYSGVRIEEQEPEELDVFVATNEDVGGSPKLSTEGADENEKVRTRDEQNDIDTYEGEGGSMLSTLVDVEVEGESILLDDGEGQQF